MRDATVGRLSFSPSVSYFSALLDLSIFSSSTIPLPNPYQIKVKSLSFFHHSPVLTGTMASTPLLPPLGNKEQSGYEWNLVIKVNYGDILRRFSAYVHQPLMIIEYDMNKLRAKISSLFKFSADAVLILTYTDEDGDVVVLDNDDELRDAVICQRLNPLRINIQLKSYSTDGSYSGERAVKNYDFNSDTGSDKASPAHNGFPQLATELNSTVEKSLKSVPEPIRGVVANLSHDVIQTASSTPIFSELLFLLSKMQLTNVSQSSHEQVGNPAGMSCGTPSVVNSNTGDEPKVSDDPHHQLPTVLPQTNFVSWVPENSQRMHEVGPVLSQTNFVSSVPENSQRMHEVGRLNQCLGLTCAPVKFDQNMSKELKEGCEVHRDGKSVVATELPSMSSNIQGDNNTLGSFYKPNPNIAPMYLHGNSSTNMFPCDVTARCPVDSMFSFTLQGGSASHFDVLGNRHASPTAFPCHSPMLHPYRRSSSCHEPLPRTFHRGVICDGCGMHPIMGPRYKSTVKENYDLCSTCFRDMGSENEYARINWSAFHFPKTMKDHHKFYSSRLPSTLASHDRMKAPIPKLESCFIGDVTVWDGTVMRPCSHFTKIWRMRNNGTISWPFGTQLVRIRGDHLGGHDSAKLEIPEIGLPVDEELDIAIDFVAPLALGQYMSYWQMVSPFGQKFGEEVWVIIQVDDPQSASSACGAHALLNLNLPPKSSSQKSNRVIVYVDVDAEPLDCISAEPDANKLSEELLKPVAPYMLNLTPPDATSLLQSSNGSPASSFMGSVGSIIEVPAFLSPVSNSAIDIPESSPPVLKSVPSDMLNSAQKDGTSVLQPSIDNLPSSFMGSPLSFIEVQTTSSPISYPSIDILKSLPPVSYPLIDIPSFTNPPYTNYPPSDAFIEQDPVEQTLLRELEEMGFKQIDLNKEVLRQNQYDLEQSVQDLCGFAEWDPLLKELQEMGFDDRELNRKLLSKNGGSLKRVVMDLISGNRYE